MNEIDLVRQLKKLSDEHHKTHLVNILEQMELLLLKYVKENPQSTTAWLKLAMLEYTAPLEDPERIEKYLKSILSYDPHNIDAILILSYMQNLFWGEVKNATFSKLCTIRSKNLEKQSMIELAISWYYKNRDKEKYKQHLIKSEIFYDKHAHNLRNLGIVYLKEGKVKEGRQLIEKALHNITYLYSEDDNFDITDVQEFYNEFIKGIHKTPEGKERMKRLLTK